MLSLLVALSNGNALKNNLPRKPAFVDVQPSQPEFKPLAPGDFRQNLLMYVGIEGNLKFWSGHKHSLEGFYLLETSKEKIFLKVISDVYEEKEILANEIANWVYSQGILTSRLLPNFPIRIPNELVVLGYQFISGRFATNKKEDLESLGFWISKLHAALLTMPKKEQIKTAALKKASSLKSRAAILKAKPNAKCANKHKLSKLLEEHDMNESELTNTRLQLAHGDLVYANVIFLPDRRPFFLDFEDSVQCWQPVDLDICLALERFAILPSKNPDQLIDSMRAFLSSYAHASGENRFLSQPIYQSLKQIIIQKMLTVAEMEAAGLISSQEEWDKFFWLYNNSKGIRGLLEKVDEQYRI